MNKFHWAVIIEIWRILEFYWRQGMKNEYWVFISFWLQILQRYIGDGRIKTSLSIFI